MLVTEERLLDAAGRPRSPATMPGYHAGRPPGNKGVRYPADPPRVEEIVSVMRQAGPGIHGARLRGLIVVLWRAGLRISEALSLAERDLDPARGALLVRNGKGGKRREVGMDEWGWEQLRPWLDHRARIPIGALFCVINGPTCGRPWSGPAARTQLRRLALAAGVRRRFAPHQLRHAHAVEMAREGVPLNVIQRQLGHADLGVTSVYLQGIDNTEVISAVHSRRAPTMPAVLGCSSSARRAKEERRASCDPFPGLVRSGSGSGPLAVRSGPVGWFDLSHRLEELHMYVSVIHRVSDPEAFMKAEDEAIAAGLPDGFSLPIHAATDDHAVGICIWEGPSVDSVRELVESVVGPFSENEYHEMKVDGLS